MICEHYSYHVLHRLRIFFKQTGLYEISLQFFFIIYLFYKQSLFIIEKLEYRSYHEGKQTVVLTLGWMYFDFFPMCFFFQKYGYTHLSAGELLRDERKNPDSQYGELIEKYIKDGKIVPVEITISLLRRVRSVNANQLKPTRKWEIKSALPLSNEKNQSIEFLACGGWSWCLRMAELEIPLSPGKKLDSRKHSLPWSRISYNWTFICVHLTLPSMQRIHPPSISISFSSFPFSVFFQTLSLPPSFFPSLSPSHDPPIVAILSVLMFPFLVHASPSSVWNAETNSYQTKIGPV